MNSGYPTPPAATAAAGAELGQYLTFVLGGDAYAIGILSIKEIIEYEGVRAVPMMPAYIRGVINLRGAAVPVLDLHVRFGMKAAEVSKRTCIVIIEVEVNAERTVIGLLVDAVSAVVDIPASGIEPPPTLGAKIRTDFMRGMGKINDRFVILLDVNHVLAADEVSTLVEASNS
ncbi:MAG: purine-binding chemotaxis protein CheW [Proteobacteria bacterium]|nr:purine-binding chemotaxis protein CheW [Pseudomonadota bacterium]